MPQKDRKAGRKVASVVENAAIAKPQKTEHSAESLATESWETYLKSEIDTAEFLAQKIRKAAEKLKNI